MEEKWVIGRPIEGVFLNGIEFLQREDGKVVEFSGIDDATRFAILTLEIDSSEVQDYLYTKEFYENSRCRTINKV